MATGPEHYREAERLLALAEAHESQAGPDSPALPNLYGGAIAHAVLATAAATALNDHNPEEGGMPLEDYAAWQAVAGMRQPKRKTGEDR